MRCSHCLTIFQPKRKTAKFCSPKCRVYSSRDSVTQSVPSVTVTVTKEPLSVTNINQQGSGSVTEKGYTFVEGELCPTCGKAGKEVEREDGLTHYCAKCAKAYGR